MALSGDAVAVDDVWTEALDEPVAVYNLQVADFHTYYAGGVCVLVHNADYNDSEKLKQAREDGLLEGSGHTNPAHKEAINNKLEELLDEKKPGVEPETRKYEKLYANRSLSTVNRDYPGLNLVGTEKPDIVAVRYDEELKKYVCEIWEFASPSQASGTGLRDLSDKLNLMRKNNPDVEINPIVPWDSIEKP
jgi:hypothetical protein